MLETRNITTFSPVVTAFLAKPGHRFQKKDVLVFIPAYDEEKTIAEVVRGVRQVCDYDILVIDDGSSDKTPSVLASLDVEVLRRINGEGSRIIDGLSVGYAFGYRYTVKIDGDGQHDPMDLNRLYGHAIATGSDIIIGSRHKEEFKGSINWIRSLGMRFCSFVIKTLYGRTISDTTSGLKMWSRTACGLAIESFQRGKLKHGSTYHVEELILALKHGLQVEEINVVMFPRAHGESKSFSRWELVTFPLQLVRSVFRGFT